MLQGPKAEQRFYSKGVCEIYEGTQDMRTKGAKTRGQRENKGLEIPKNAHPAVCK
jgi:hypothetical protein